MSMNNAACVVLDGRLVSFAEEERFLRVKHAPHVFPERAVEFCLSAAGVTPRQVDVTAIGFSAPQENSVVPDDVAAYLAGRLAPERQFGFFTGTAMLHRDMLIRSYGRRLYFDHHLSHVASAAIPSGFRSANFISLDGWGGEVSGLVGFWDGAELKVSTEIPVANSWGMVFELVTFYLGFRPHSGEGKTMGLAAYGQVDSELLPDWCDARLGLPDTERYRKFLADNIAYRGPDEPLTERHRNLAATLQFYYERSLLKIGRVLMEQSGSKRFVLAGGVALNCSANGKLAEQEWVEDIFVQPASHDAGTALGAAILAHREVTGSWPDCHFEHAYFGPWFRDEEIHSILRATGVAFEEVDPAKAIADALARNQVTGVFQGRAEVGPRALGNRSILANPQHPDNLRRVNCIKRREGWRPLAPSVLEEAFTEVFSSRIRSEFMLLASTIRPSWRDRIPAVVHVDGSARPQAVSEGTNPLFRSIIEEFRRQSDCPAVLNTSFNLDYEPIVNTPENAIGTFYASGLDVLVIGRFKVQKPDKPGN